MKTKHFVLSIIIVICGLIFIPTDNNDKLDVKDKYHQADWQNESCGEMYYSNTSWHLSKYPDSVELKGLVRKALSDKNLDKGEYQEIMDFYYKLDTDKANLKLEQTKSELMEKLK